jgi:hypothetical protein
VAIVIVVSVRDRSSSKGRLPDGVDVANEKKGGSWSSVDELDVAPECADGGA